MQTGVPVLPWQTILIQLPNRLIRPSELFLHLFVVVVVVVM